MEPKIETELKYDDRRKELVQHIKTTQEIKIGEVVVGETVIERKSVLKEQGIRNTLSDLSSQRTKLEQTIKQLKDGLKEAPEMTEDLKELEKKIQDINSFNKNKQTQSQIEVNEIDLKNVKKDINEIKDTIGSRLKL